MARLEGVFSDETDTNKTSHLNNAIALSSEIVGLLPYDCVRSAFVVRRVGEVGENFWPISVTIGIFKSSIVVAEF